MLKIEKPCPAQYCGYKSLYSSCDIYCVRTLNAAEYTFAINMRTIAQSARTPHNDPLASYTLSALLKKRDASPDYQEIRLCGTSAVPFPLDHFDPARPSLKRNGVRADNSDFQNN